MSNILQLLTKRLNPAILFSVLALTISSCQRFNWPDDSATGGTVPSPSAAAFKASITSPADGTTSVPLSSQVVIGFSLRANTSSLSYNLTSGACSGSFQLSGDNFNTCSGISSAAWNSQLTSVTLTPAVALLTGTVYKIKISTTLSSATGTPLTTNFVSGGFTTVGLPPLAVTSTSPADAQMNVTLNTSMTISFNSPVNTGTESHNSTSGTCTGSVQLSSDNFVTCIGLGTSSWNGAFTLLTLTPVTALNPGTLYKISVTTALVGSGGELLTSNYTSATGFGTTINAPAGAFAYASNTQNAIVWQTVAGASSYNLYFSNTPGVTTGSGTLISGVNPPFNHAGLTNGLSYYYIVVGVNGAVLGQPSAEFTASPIGFKYAFVTSASYNGNLGGLSGADANCNTRASATGLPGQYAAYLSDSTTDAACHMLGLSGTLATNCGYAYPLPMTAVGPYQNTTGQIVNVNLDSLIYGKAPTTSTCAGGSPSLLNPIAFDETGASASLATPFTGTQCGAASGANCSNWTSSALASANAGQASSTSSTWSSYSSLSLCLAGAPLYCMQK